MTKHSIPSSKPLSYREQAIMAIMMALNDIVRDPNWIEFFYLSRQATYRVSGTREIMMEFSNTWQEQGDEDRITLRLTTDNSPDDYAVDFTWKRPPHGARVSQEDLKLDIYWLKPGDKLNKAELMALAIMFCKVYPEKEDKDMSSEQLEMKYLDLNGGYHPVHTVEAWQSLVAANMTRSGYWSWVYQALRMEGLEKEPLEA